MGKCGKIVGSGTRQDEAGDQARPTAAVRYGKIGRIGEFAYAPTLRFTCGAKVVISTERGIEIGEHVSLIGCACDKGVSTDQIRAYAEASEGDEIFRFDNGRILREASEADLAEARHIEGTAPERLETCRSFARDLGLNMKIVECEQILGGERIIFYFMAEERVDFRQLVRRLASEFQTRIEMRQIGARDEARLLADYETCGRECCCRNFLKNLKPVGMAMAKLQKTTLDVAKVSGRCGRLKCCLRYEQESYEALDRQLPKNGIWVSTPEGVGRVVDRQILTQLVKIRTVEGRVLPVAAEQILERNVPPPPEPAAPERPAAETRASARRRGSTGKYEPALRETPLPTTDPEPAAQEEPAESARPEAEGEGPTRPKRRRRGRRSRRGRRGSGEGNPQDAGG